MADISNKVKFNFGQNIRRLRESKKLTQAEFAQLLTATRSYVAQLESGKVGFSSESIALLSEVLDVDASELLKSVVVGGEMAADLSRGTIANASSGTYTYTNSFAAVGAALSNPLVAEALELFARLPDDAQRTALVTLKLIASGADREDDAQTEREALDLADAILEGRKLEKSRRSKA